jgi:hypothetical protein
MASGKKLRTSPRVSMGNLTMCSPVTSTLNMEAAGSFETLEV